MLPMCSTRKSHRQQPPQRLVASRRPGSSLMIPLSVWVIYACGIRGTLAGKGRGLCTAPRFNWALYLVSKRPGHGREEARP